MLLQPPLFVAARPLPIEPESDLIGCTNEEPVAMKLIRLCIPTIVLALLAMPMSQAFAQRNTFQSLQADKGDQPGVIPDAADEELSPEFARQMVFFRSNEEPGTIVVQTSERFLYVVQPGL